MADLTQVLPGFDLQPWRHLTYSLEKKNILTAELISQDPVDIVRKCPLPLKEVKRMVAAINVAISNNVVSEAPKQPGLRPASNGLTFVKTLDTNIDLCLGGGFPAGYISEIVGESAVGKTQFVLSLLLSAQLPPPKGLGRAVMYLSTEDKLNTSRLHQMSESNPEYQSLPVQDRPNMDRIYTMSTRNFDHQENIIQYKLPFLVQQHNIGLVIIDSVAANFRIQFPGAVPTTLARRAIALAKLGKILRQIAHEHNVAIVVTNQVADRFGEARVVPDKLRTCSSTPSSSANDAHNQKSRSTQNTVGPHPTRLLPLSLAQKDEVMSLDYQQCFFTGWGNDDHGSHEALKTPALGLAWANQIDARIALKISDSLRPTMTENIYTDRKRDRCLNVVFATWTPPSITPVKYELSAQGLVSIPLEGNRPYSQLEDFENDDDDDRNLKDPEINANDCDEIREMLDPKYWEDDSIEDNEFLRT